MRVSYLRRPFLINGMIQITLLSRERHLWWHAAAATLPEEVKPMIDPADVSVPTIEYLFMQQIMKLTADTVRQR